MVEKFVYFIRPVGMEGPIKIGCSYQPIRRLKTLMIWSPFPLEIVVAIPGDTSLERNIHECFSDQHTHSEWFQPSDDLLAFVDRLCSGVPVEKATDLSARKGPLRNRRPMTKEHWSPEKRKFRDYQGRVRRAEKKLRVDDLYAPAFVERIIREWRGYDHHTGTYTFAEPSAEKVATIDAFLSSPRDFAVSYEERYPKVVAG